MILFLDFDGTLHPLWTFSVDGQGRTVAKSYDGPWLREAPILESILHPYEGRVEIVLSSWWAFHRGLDAARALLPDGLARNVTDCIYLPELTTSAWSEYRSKLVTRHACIHLWLDRRRPGYAGPWLALDDDDQSWPEQERHRLVLARGTLANPSVQQELKRRLDEALRTST